ncbi:MAG: hypothetical protein IK135_00765 [Bacteroidales bacterium]|nr:hypothetical protein [Bacteroidales bacterium]
MKKLFTLFLLLSSTLVPFTNTVTAQEVTTEGTEFWVSFMGNGFEHNDYGGSPYLITQLLISAKQDCSGTITNPNDPSWSYDFSVSANNITFIDIPRSQGYVELNEYTTPVNKGLFIQSTAPISVFCANAARYSFDASYVLPTQALADDYIIQSYKPKNSILPDDNTSAFLIIATEEGETLVDITPKTKTLDNRPANEEFTISLQQGQVYQVRSNNSWDSSRDLSGSRVTARDCKKIAIFNGDNLTSVPSHEDEYDCIFEQAMPIKAWGKKFVATASMGRQEKDRIIITSAYDDNEIIINGQPIFTLNTGQSEQIELLNASCFIEAMHSCAVYLYNHSTEGNFINRIGAPSMVWIAPIEQRINSLTFSTFNDNMPGHVNVNNHYVNIIIKSEDSGNVTLDDELIDPLLFEDVIGTNEYKFCRKSISHGVHSLSCPNGFNAHVYGFGEATGYAYMAGSKATDLTTKVFIDGIEILEGDTVTNCSLDPIAFSAEINANYDEVTWDFGDGTPHYHDANIEHTYESNGLYEASLNVLINGTACQASSEQTIHFYIDSSIESPDEYFEEICQGELYDAHDLEPFIAERDTIISSEIIDCRGLIVNLTVHPRVFDTIFDTICFKGPGIYEDYGFHLEYDAPNHYEDQIATTSEFGCEKQVDLRLVVSELVEMEPDTITGVCDSYTWPWNQVTYYNDTIVADTIPNPEGCYTIAHLVLDVDHSARPKEIQPVHWQEASHWVIPANNLQIRSYEYILEDNVPDAIYNEIIWELEGNCNWRIIPNENNPKRCKVVVINHTEDTIWLHATANGPCFEEGVTRSYWLVCSFYGTEENESSRKVDVVPNPNQGNMNLCFHGMEGVVNVQIYDMKGLLVDRFDLYNDEESRHNYTLKTPSKGLFLFVFKQDDIQFIRKVLITD